MRSNWPHHTGHWWKTLFKHKTVRLLEMGLRVNFKRIFVFATLMGWRAVNSCSTFTKHCRRLKWLFSGGLSERPDRNYKAMCAFSPLELTVVQSDEKYSLNHVIDIKLLTELLSWAEGATDLCHRVVIVINTVWHRVLWLWLAISRILHYNTRYIVIKTDKEKKDYISILLLTYHTQSSYALTKHTVCLKGSKS